MANPIKDKSGIPSQFGTRILRRFMSEAELRALADKYTKAQFPRKHVYQPTPEHIALFERFVSGEITAYQMHQLMGCSFGTAMTRFGSWSASILRPKA